MKNTKDYGQFKRIESNRPIDGIHVKQLVKSISEKNLLHLNPIVVDNDNRIIDGQHRLEAARILGLEIYFIVDASVKSQDISRLNTAKKNWNIMDYIRYNAAEGKKEFNQVLEFLEKYPRMKLTCLLNLCSSNNAGRYADEIRSGKVDISNIKLAYQIAEMISELYNFPMKEFVFDSRFGIALKEAMADDNFNFKILKEKIQANSRRFVKCQTIREYLGMIEEIYNYRSSKNLINIS